MAARSERGSSTACPGASRKSKDTGHSAQNDDGRKRVGLWCWRGEADDQKLHGGAMVRIGGLELTIGFG